MRQLQTDGLVKDRLVAKGASKQIVKEKKAAVRMDPDRNLSTLLGIMGPLNSSRLFPLL